jgi:predicted nucleotidyltransferase
VDAWLDALQAQLPRHAAMLDALLAICRADDRIRLLELQCSVARGAGDELSDLDVGMAVRDDAWVEVADELPDLLRGIAEPVDLLAHAMPEWGGRPHRRLFVQYADGRQIDLVVQPASAMRGRVPAAIVLHDPDGLLAEERVVDAATATLDDLRTWDMLGWESLANVAKYLQRGSAWEALARLTEARDLALRLWAAAEDVPYPVFGLTSLLDADPPRLPDGLDATAARADLGELAVAARACAELLRRASAGARRRLGSPDPESPMDAWVNERLG